MKDRVPANPGRVLITPEDGSAAFYATMTRADNPTQEGDALNKNNLLKDATAALFGLGADAVPNDVFDFVGKYISAAPKIATGSYIGTGVSTQSEPVILKFGFAPKFVFIASDSYQIWGDSGVFSNMFAMQIWIAGISSYEFYDYNTNSYRYFSSDNNGLSFYEVTGDGSWSTYSLNRADHAYHYFAVG